MKVGHSLSLLLAALCLAALQGCSTGFSDDAATKGSEMNLRRQEMTAGMFRLTVFSRIRDTNQPVTVYVEGDVPGLTPSTDPGVDSTPDDNLGLRLARLDPSDNVVFISHPCQFDIDDFACSQRETGAWAELYYTSMRRALDYVLSVVPHPRLNLVGYSGGGAMAAVLAARRYDVISLRTIAGNLDPDGDGRAHAADPQNDFIDPMKIAPRLALLPQEHFVGDQDVFVPSFLTENFVKAIGPSSCVKVTHIPEATHKTGWEEAWKVNVMKFPACSATARE